MQSRRNPHLLAAGPFADLDRGFVVVPAILFAAALFALLALPIAAPEASLAAEVVSVVAA